MCNSYVDAKCPNGTEELAKIRLTMLWAMANFLDRLDRSDQFLDLAFAKATVESGQLFLDCYQALADIAHKSGAKRWFLRSWGLKSVTEIATEGAPCKRARP